MSKLKGTKTAQNLMTAFAGESQARMRYDYYASQAKKDGYVQIKNIFEETSIYFILHILAISLALFINTC